LVRNHATEVRLQVEDPFLWKQLALYVGTPIDPQALPFPFIATRRYEVTTAGERCVTVICLDPCVYLTTRV
jgi:hypothetical protein